MLQLYLRLLYVPCEREELNIIINISNSDVITPLPPSHTNTKYHFLSLPYRKTMQLKHGFYKIEFTKLHLKHFIRKRKLYLWYKPHHSAGPTVRFSRSKYNWRKGGKVFWYSNWHTLNITKISCETKAWWIGWYYNTLC